VRVGGFHELFRGRVEIEGRFGLSGCEGFHTAAAGEGKDAEMDGREAGEEVDELEVRSVFAIGAARGDEETGPHSADPVFVDS